MASISNASEFVFGLELEIEGNAHSKKKKKYRFLNLNIFLFKLFQTKWKLKAKRKIILIWKKSFFITQKKSLQMRSFKQFCKIFLAQEFLLDTQEWYAIKKENKNDEKNCEYEKEKF